MFACKGCIVVPCICICVEVAPFLSIGTSSSVPRARCQTAPSTFYDASAQNQKIFKDLFTLEWSFSTQVTTRVFRKELFSVCPVHTTMQPCGVQKCSLPLWLIYLHNCGDLAPSNPILVRSYTNHMAHSIGMCPSFTTWKHFAQGKGPFCPPHPLLVPTLGR